MSVDETLYVVTKGRERIAMQGEFAWMVTGPDTVLTLPSEREAKAVAHILTRVWTCRGPDGKGTCQYSRYCKFSRMRLQLLAGKRGPECEFYQGFTERAETVGKDTAA